MKPVYSWTFCHFSSCARLTPEARQVVNALHEHQLVTKHALDALCALLRTCSASRVPLLDFYRLFCTQSCSICENQYGDLVYLPTWIRCCSRCVRNRASRLRVVTLASVKRVLRPSKKSLAKLLTITTVPGLYTMEERTRSSRITIVPTQSAFSVYSEGNGGSQPTPETIGKLQTQPILTFMACCALPS